MEPDGPRQEPVDRAALQSLAEQLEDAEIVARLVGRYRDALAERCTAIVAAVGQDDAAEVAATAHALRSASAQFGAVELAALSGELEELGRAGDVGGAHELLGPLDDCAARTRAALADLDALELG